MIANFSRLLFIVVTLFITNFVSVAQVRRVNNNVNCTVNTVVRVFEYDEVDQKPEFPGGNDEILGYINDHREYPREAYDKGIQGRVTCSFIINVDGSISDVQLVRSANSLLNQEAIRIFQSMPRWTPGRHDGRAVRVRKTESVSFRR